MGIKEILAAKKAKEEAEKQGVQENATPSNDTAGDSLDGVSTAGNTDSKELVDSVISTVVPVVLKEATKPEYPTHGADGKPLSGFAMIQARKKIDAAWASLQEAVQKDKQESPKLEEALKVIVDSPVNEEPIKIEQSTPVDNAEPLEPSDPAAEQAYSDIKARLDAIVSLSEENLKTAMQDLKKALMQNPNAISLMLPSDIGQMVIALRKMTGVEIAKAETTAKAGKVSKKKEAILTAEQMEEAWKEL